MRAGRRRRRARPGVRLALGIGLGIGLIALGTLWLVFQHKPDWYRPVTVDETVLQQARRDSAATVDTISKQIVEGRTFEVTLRDHTVNEWLAALPHQWPDARRSIPPEISDIALSFDAGKIRLGALCVRGGWRTIVSVGLTLGVSPDGSEASIALADAHGGSLPVPRAVLEDVLQRVLQHARSNPSSADDDPGELGSILRSVRSVDELFEGVKVENRFVWPNGARPFRIDAITARAGELRLRLEPL